MVKKPPANAGDPGLIPESGRYPGEGKGNPLQYSCLENLISRGTTTTKSKQNAKLLAHPIGGLAYTTISPMTVPSIDQVCRKKLLRLKGVTHENSNQYNDNSVILLYLLISEELLKILSF